MNYYENIKKIRLNSIRKVYDEFNKKINNDCNYNDYNDEKEEYFVEGKAKKVLVNIYERDQKARKKCIDHYGYKCFACDTILSDIYGEIAENFIHIHHIIELSSLKKEYVVDPIKDLRPLCPNCHSVIHRKSPVLSIDELKNIIRINSC